MSIMVSIQLYAVDGFKFPASAFASISVLRCLFAGAFPLFGPKLFHELGVDWGVALLAFLTLGLGLPLVGLVCLTSSRPVPLLDHRLTVHQLYVFGPKLRKIGVERMDRFEGRDK
jgi:hypothetical protein